MRVRLAAEPLRVDDLNAVARVYVVDDPPYGVVVAVPRDAGDDLFVVVARRRRGGRRNERLRQPLGELVDLLDGRRVRRLDVAVQLRVADDADRVAHVVEDEERLGEHEYRFGQPERVLLRRRQSLEVIDRLVGEEADRAAVEAAHLRHVDDLVAGQRLLDRLQRVYRAVGTSRPGRDDVVGLGADEAVARETLAALHALQQERVRPARHLEVGRHRRVEVGADLAVDGQQVALACQLLGFFQCWPIHLAFPPSWLPAAAGPCAASPLRASGR